MVPLVLTKPKQISFDKQKWLAFDGMYSDARYSMQKAWMVAVPMAKSLISDRFNCFLNSNIISNVNGRRLRDAAMVEDDMRWS